MVARVLILASDGIETGDLAELRRALESAGLELSLAAPGGATVRGWAGGEGAGGHWADPIAVDLAISDVDEDHYAALIVASGPFSAEGLRIDDVAVDLVEDFDADGKPVAALGKGVALLIEADILAGRTVTGASVLHSDLENAGGDVVDRAVAVDENLITARDTSAIAALAQALIDALESEGDKEPDDEEPDD